VTCPDSLSQDSRIFDRDPKKGVVSGGRPFMVAPPEESLPLPVAVDSGSVKYIKNKTKQKKKQCKKLNLSLSLTHTHTHTHTHGIRKLPSPQEQI
jgi:hypothetical protein